MLVWYDVSNTDTEINTPRQFGVGGGECFCGAPPSQFLGQSVTWTSSNRRVFGAFFAIHRLERGAVFRDFFVRAAKFSWRAIFPVFRRDSRAPILPKNAQNRALRTSSLARIFRPQTFRPNFFFSADKFWLQKMFDEFHIFFESDFSIFFHISKNFSPAALGRNAIVISVFVLIAMRF